VEELGRTPRLVAPPEGRNSTGKKKSELDGKGETLLRRLLRGGEALSKKFLRTGI